MCGHNVWNTVGAVVILVLAIWPQVIPLYIWDTNLVIIVVATLMLLHGLLCKNCGALLSKLSSQKKRKK